MSAAMDSEAAATTLGARGWIQKPFDVEHMLKLVAQHVPADRYESKTRQAVRGPVLFPQAA
jgi:DNA-binding NtrC family response regulator